MTNEEIYAALTECDSTAAFDMVGRVDEWAKLVFEQHLFILSHNILVGYTGGLWESRRLTDELFFAYPAMMDSERVRLVNWHNQSDVVTGRNTAGAALTLLALNHTLWALHERLPNDLYEQLEQLFYAYREAVYDESNPLNKEALFQITD